MRPICLVLEEFQFLIGSLEALGKKNQIRRHNRFNSSQVVWKPDCAANFVSGSRFNSSQVVWKPDCAANFVSGSRFNSSQVVWKRDGKAVLWDIEEFQFLIGSLEALYLVQEQDKDTLFQFLIGSLEAIPGTIDQSQLRVSIPHRQSGSYIILCRYA